jgi:hypothetical protein
MNWEGVMLKTSQFTLVILSVVAFGPSPAALAGQVTNADLAGRRICWNNGVSVDYHRDGSLYSAQEGKGTWRLNGGTLKETGGPRGSYVWRVTKDGGNFHLSLQTAPYEVDGSYCK